MSRGQIAGCQPNHGIAKVDDVTHHSPTFALATGSPCRPHDLDDQRSLTTHAHGRRSPAAHVSVAPALVAITPASAME